MIQYRHGKRVYEGDVENAPKPKRQRTQWEHHEQVRLFRWAGLQVGRFPCLVYLHASMNGARRRDGGKLVSAGLRRGVPDVFLPFPLGRFAGLWIELKDPGGPGRSKGTVSDDQARWIAWLNEHGYMAVVAYGWEEAAALIVEYLAERGE